MLDTVKVGGFYRTAQHPDHLYKVVAVCGQKVTVILHSVDGAPVPVAEAVEMSLCRARASFVPVEDAERQLSLGRQVARRRRGVLRRLAQE